MTKRLSESLGKRIYLPSLELLSPTLVILNQGRIALVATKYGISRSLWDLWAWETESHSLSETDDAFLS